MHEYIHACMKIDQLQEYLNVDKSMKGAVHYEDSHEDLFKVKPWLLLIEDDISTAKKLWQTLKHEWSWYETRAT